MRRPKSKVIFVPTRGARGDTNNQTSKVRRSVHTIITCMTTCDTTRLTELLSRCFKIMFDGQSVCFKSVLPANYIGNAANKQSYKAT